MPAGRPFLLRDTIRYVPFVLAGGALIAYVLSGFGLGVRNLVLGAFIGFCCFAAALLGERLFSPWFEKQPEAWWRRAAVYFVASQIAWPIGLLVGIYVLWGATLSQIRFPRQVFVVVIAIGAAGSLIGLGAQTYERMKDRLSRSIEQLKEKEYADKELQLARELQSRMLPAPEIAADGYRISGRNFAARYVAGDFYDVFTYADGAVGVAVADVAGKGMAASLIMASVKAVLPLLASTRSIEEAMIALNEKLTNELAKREFVAMTLARYEPASGRVEVANAGLPDPYLIRADGSVTAIEVPGPRLPLGLRPSIAYEKQTIALGHGETLMLFSDGLPEATTASGDQIGYERLAEMVRTARGDIDALLQQIHAIEVEPRDDDQTVVTIRRV